MGVVTVAELIEELQRLDQSLTVYSVYGDPEWMEEIGRAVMHEPGDSVHSYQVPEPRWVEIC
jgi:hypothetical protein